MTGPAPHAEAGELLRELISIPSVNPIYDPASQAEAGVATFVEDYGRRLGLDVERQPVVDGRDNIIVRLTRPGSRRVLLLETHMDTVAVEPMDDAGPRVRNGVIYGRGACDAKGSLAAMLAALGELVKPRRELVNDVVLLAAVDEEFKFRGVLTFISSGERVDGAIVGEPTDLRLVIAHKGCVRFTVTTLGRAGHSSRPETGSNAISAMARVVHALDELARQLETRPHAVVGPPTLSIGRIWGGTGVNTIPGRATIEVDRRLVPGETANGALEEVDAILDGLDVRSERDEPFLVTPPLDTPPDAPVVAAVAAACRASKLSSEPTGVPYGSDASKLWAYAGVPSVVLGPGSIDAAHSAAEHVRVDDLVAAARVYLGAALVPL